MEGVYMIKVEEIREKLGEVLERSGLTQSEIARRLNMRQSNISHYIKGDKMPSLDTFANLCEVLDLDANDILCIKREV